ncbi:MAG: ATP-binding protein [Rhodothermales bacterium]
MAITWGGRSWRIAHVAVRALEQQETVVSSALVHIEREFDEMQRALLARGKALAEAPEVSQALQQRYLGNPEGSEALVRLFAHLELPQRWAVELYDTSLEQPVAWNGFSIPLDEAPEALRFLETFQTAIAEDSDWRQALVMWYPVRDGVRALGAVRMMRLLRARTPVQNQNLRDYSIGEVWQRDTRLPVDVQFMRPISAQAPAQGQARVLQGLDGAVLGRVVVEPPPLDRLVDTARRRFDDVLAFWMTLLLFWLVAGLWIWYRNAVTLETPDRGPRLRTGARLSLVVVAWWGARYLLLALDVPARWQRGKAPLAPLFDPAHLASTFGGGLMRSTGDFLVTAIFSVLFAFAVLEFAARFRKRGAGRLEGAGGLRRLQGMAASPWRLLASLFVTVLLAFGLMLVLATIARHTVLDSTLDFFAREDLFPEPLILLVFCTLLALTLSVVVLIVALAWIVMGQPARARRSRRWPSWVLGLGMLVAVGGPLGVIYSVFEVQPLVQWPVVLAFLAVGFSLAVMGFVQQGSGLGWLTLRSVLPSIFVMSMLLYPLFYSGLDEQRRLRMEDAAESVEGGQDLRVKFAVREMIDEAQAVSSIGPALADTARPGRRRIHLDSLATVLLRGSLLSSLGAYDASLVFLDAAGQPVGRYDASDESLSRSALEQNEIRQFDMLRQMYAESGSTDALVEPLTGRFDPDRFQYAGIVPVAEGGDLVGWIMARAEPHLLLQEGNTPFLRVLLPTDYSNLYASLSLAVFSDGVLIRSFGRNFGRYRLDKTVQKALMTQPEQWRAERVKKRHFRTYYRRVPPPLSASPVLAPVERKVVAVRIPSITTFDHLYYLLRLTVAGLLVGLPFYGGGLYLRRQAGLLPAPRVRFRDKVLNAFLVVGIIAVITVGFVGVQVVTEENDRAVQSWLRQHLQRIEETLALEAQGDEMPYRVLDRMPLDLLAARVGLDLNLYEGFTLIKYSRPQLIRERLIDKRLPIQAYEALSLDGYQFTFVEEELGTFTYTAGYRALLDEQGQPRYIVSVPTLPEQERIEEERARTIAYLFGALLALLVMVMVTASLMANALARPIARLREGLEDAAKGRFERVLPVETRDEVGELVQTFNEMQAQLAESRRQLAQQERQLAWREMARQVAHEIKNPLTPMKLSVQHLRRAYEDVETDGTPEPGSNVQEQRFSRLFKRITGTLVEQIDSLARIANEFSSFARMPTRILERLDLNVVVRQAVALMQEEAGADISLHLAPEPLAVEADREELRRIYINLIKNALQALHHDGEGRVTVSTRREPAPDGQAGHAYSAVTDTGLGIPPDLQDKIFEPNFSTKTSGTGLGLAIARKSIEEFHGAIGFETDEGAGTTFWIRLPLVE